MEFMNIGYVLAIIFFVLSMISGYWGIDINDKKNKESSAPNISVRNFFSDTQSIKILPSSLGGNDSLNLDNVATLQVHVPYTENSITLLLDVVTTELPSISTESMTVEGVTTYNHRLGATYFFDTAEHKRHNISVGNRTFVVTLLGVKMLDVPNVPVAREYEFGISEK